MSQAYKLVYTVPFTHLAATKTAIFEAGGGVYAQGKYINVAFETQGNGQFIPVSAAGAKPYAGEVDVLECTKEVKVEIRCVGEEVVRKAVEGLKREHPYEEVAYEVYKIEAF